MNIITREKVQNFILCTSKEGFPVHPTLFYQIRHIVVNCYVSLGKCTVVI